MLPVRGVLPLYADEDRLEKSLVSAMRAAGFDELTALEAKRLAATDEEQLLNAARLRRVLFSGNVRDFSRIHGDWMRTGRQHWRIVLANDQFWSVGEQVRRLVVLKESVADTRNQLLYLSNCG